MSLIGKNINIGQNIKNLRIKNNISQEELAERLQVTLRTVKNWEKNVTTPNTGYLYNIAIIMEISFITLLKENIQ